MQKVRIWAHSPAKWVQLTPNMYQCQMPEWRIDGRIFINSQLEIVGEWKPEKVFSEGEKPCALMLVERIFRGIPYKEMATIKCTLLRVMDEDEWDYLKKYID